MATGAFVGVAAGLPVSSGDPAPLVALVIVGGGLVSTVRALVPAASMATVLRVVVFAFALRAAAATLIFTASTLAGRGGFVTGDDAGYSAVAWGLAQYLRGTPEPPYAPPHWNGAAYLFGPFTYLETAVFYLFGPRVILVELINAGFASASIVFIYRIARSILGKPAGTVTSWMVAVYPSLVLWSALNLREGLAFLVTAATLWALMELQRTRDPRFALGAAGLLLAASQVRGFTFAGLLAAAGMTAASLVHVRKDSDRRRAIAAAAGVVAIALVTLAIAPDRLLVPQLRSFEAVREAMADEARTAFHRPAPVVASDGDTFVVVMRPTARSLVVPFGDFAPPGYLGGTLSQERNVVPADENASLLWVQPPARLIVVTVGAGTADDAAVRVRPGDIVVMGTPGRVPRPAPDRRPLAINDLRGDHPGVQLEPAPYRAEQGVVGRTALHVPVGIAYALFSPFPFDLRRDALAFTVPEMLLWYAAIASAGWGLWTRRRRLRRTAPVLVFVVVVLGIFALAEGNSGILFRHRAMVIPYGLALAAPGLIASVRALRTLARSTAPRAMRA